MSDCVLKSQIYKYSSSKLLTLLEVLKNAMPKERVCVVSDDSNADELSEEDMTRILATETKKKKFCTIVFVERRFTAKIVYMVLKVTVLLCGAHYIWWSCPHSISAFLNLVTDKFVFVVNHSPSHKAFIVSGVLSSNY